MSQVVLSFVVHSGQRLVRTWFLEIAFVQEVGVCACVYVCVRVCVCVCACPEDINNQWHDVTHDKGPI